MVHGPHQGAHRSMSTSWSVSSAAFRSESVAFTSQGSGAWQDAHWGRPEDATGTLLRVLQEGQIVIELMPPTVPAGAANPASYDR